MPAASPGEAPKRGGWHAIGDALSVIGWFCFGACVLLFILWYITGLSASGVSGRIGVVTNPDAPQDQWQYEPAADVEVFIRWNGELASNLIQFENYCARTLIVRTDREGRFSVDGWWERPRWPPPRVEFGHAIPLKAGLMTQYFPYPSTPPEGFDTVLGPPPPDSAMALAFAEEWDPRNRAGIDHCPRG